MELVGKPLHFLMKQKLKPEAREEIVRAVAGVSATFLHSGLFDLA
jgi:hypothetical protein